MNNNNIAQILKTHVVSVVIIGGVFLAPTSGALEKPVQSGAQDEGKRPHQRGEKHKVPRDGTKPERKGKAREGGFKQLDQNQDGVLSFEEFSQSKRLARLEEEKQRRLFDFLDRNKDGKLQSAELRPREPHWAGALRNDFRALDADHNDSLNFEEFSNAKPIADMKQAERERIFKRIDENNDGSLQRNEIRGHFQQRQKPEIDFERHDANQSGGLDYEEYSKLPFVSKFPDERRKKHFSKIDIDGNGEISLKEIHAAHKRRPRPLHRDHPKPERRE